MSTKLIRLLPMKNYKSLFVPLFMLMFSFQIQAQQHLSYLYDDGEFSELAVRNTALLFGYSSDSLDEFVADQKEKYLRHKEMLASPGLKGTSSVTSIASTGCPCIVNNCPIFSLPAACNHSSVNSEPDFFETAPRLGKWCGQIGGYSPSNSTWAYFPDPFSKIDNYRQMLVTGKGIDPVGKFPIVAPGSTYSVRLGGPVPGAESEKLITRYTINSNTRGQYLNYRYAIVLEDPGHTLLEQPSFKVAVYEQNQTTGALTELCCAGYEVYSGNVPGFETSTTGSKYKSWSSNIVDFGFLYDEAGGGSGDKVFIVEFTTRDCTLGGHYGYAYIDGSSLKPKINKTGRLCDGMELQFNSEILGRYNEERVKWTFGNDETIEATINYSANTVSIINAIPSIPSPTIEKIIHPKVIYRPDALPKTVKCTLEVRKTSDATECGAPITITRDLIIQNCTQVILDCEDCIQSFAPIPGEKYVLNAWVSQRTDDYTADKTLQYNAPNIQIKLNGPDIVLGPFLAKGKVIDGWQKVEEAFDIPLGTSSIEIILNNNVLEGSTTAINTTPSAERQVYFDDIRINPFRAQMKSFVYDPLSQKLRAELDENNYATFYEYDEEGALIRVKKETEKGISTIKESINNTRKKQ
jgi:hypothetical protein